MKQIKERNLNKNNRTPLHVARNPPPYPEIEVKKAIKMEELLLSKGAKDEPSSK